MNKHRMYMEIAKTVSMNGTCSRAKVGAVLVNNDRVIGVGYNGAPRGQDHCTDIGCDIVEVEGKPHCVRSVHAEENVIANAAFGGSSTEGSTLYCTFSPCYACSRILINAGVTQVFYLKEYPDTRARKIWEKAPKRQLYSCWAAPYGEEEKEEDSGPRCFASPSQKG